MRVAMVELATAHNYAQDVRCDRWQFAVEIEHLTAMGLTADDIRWLVARSYIEVAREVSRYSDTLRKFQPLRSVRFGKKTCFVITAAGLRLITVEPRRTMLQPTSVRKAA
jgi:hypothetical protein